MASFETEKVLIMELKCCIKYIKLLTEYIPFRILTNPFQTFAIREAFAILLTPGFKGKQNVCDLSDQNQLPPNIKHELEM